MEQKVGISLCVRGTATRVVGSRMCHVSRGMAMIVTPALPTMDLECSEDFEECTVLEQMNLVAEGTAPFFSQLMPIINRSVPCVQLEEVAAARFLEEAGRIAEREKLEP